MNALAAAAIAARKFTTSSIKHAAGEASNLCNQLI